MSRTGEKIWNKTWRIFTTLLIAVLVPPGMAIWGGIYAGSQQALALRNLIWDLSYRLSVKLPYVGAGKRAAKLTDGGVLYLTCNR